LQLPRVSAEGKVLSRDSRNANDKGKAKPETSSNQILNACSQLIQFLEGF